MLGRVVTTVPRLRKSIVARPPGLTVEREMWEAGREVVVGMDEVGRGAWAGPITVGAAVAPHNRRVYKIGLKTLAAGGARGAFRPDRPLVCGLGRRTRQRRRM